MRTSRTVMRGLVLIAVIGVLASCGDDDGEATADTGPGRDMGRDATPPPLRDLGPEDDAGPDEGDMGPVDRDMGPADTDMGPTDIDMGPADVDMGPMDAGPMDMGPPDLGPPDLGPPDLGPPDLGPPDMGPPPRRIYGVTASRQLVSFSPDTPGTVTAMALTGLPMGEDIVGIDFRPATGELYGLSDASVLYRVNITTGAVTPVAGAFTPALMGSAFGFDFNPVVDRIRVQSNMAQNFRLNPDLGTVAVSDTSLAWTAGDPNDGTSPRVSGCAYPGRVGATTTTLYALEVGADALVIVNPPNAGILTTVGPLGVAFSQQTSFDIASDGATDTAYACTAATRVDPSTLYTVNLATGAATAIGVIGGGSQLVGMAVAP